VSTSLELDSMAGKGKSPGLIVDIIDTLKCFEESALWGDDDRGDGSSFVASPGDPNDSLNID
jgi:hypothetical protein